MTDFKVKEAPGLMGNVVQETNVLNFVQLFEHVVVPPHRSYFTSVILGHHVKHPVRLSE